jgi:hypothetical protein
VIINSVLLLPVAGGGYWVSKLESISVGFAQLGLAVGYSLAGTQLDGQNRQVKAARHSCFHKFQN